MALDEEPWTAMGDPNFTFSESELVDVLTFVSSLHAQDGTPTAHGLQFRPRQRADAGAPAFAGLQFQPHGPGGASFAAQHGSELVAGAPTRRGACVRVTCGCTQLREGRVVAKSRCRGDAPASHSPGEDGGNKVSHGASEKQRRDRINAMIDQLRVIVPSDAPRSGKGAGSSGDVGEGRRSKFVVLQQTINTLKSLQLRCAAQEEELARLRGAAPPAPPAASNGRSAGSAPAELPSLPTAHGVPGVEVHQGSDTRTCFVRVSTMDRRGLLADILNALRAMPLEVVRAAITTSADGRVSDCFELRLASGAGGGLRRDDIKRAVELQLLAAAADDDADEGKRRKTSVTRAASAAARR